MGREGDGLCTLRDFVPFQFGATVEMFPLRKLTLALEKVIEVSQGSRETRVRATEERGTQILGSGFRSPGLNDKALGQSTELQARENGALHGVTGVKRMKQVGVEA